MKLVLAGLAPRDEVALGLFLKRTHPTWTWESATGVRGGIDPVSDMIVLDLTTTGLGRRADASPEALLQALHGTPAILLFPAYDRSWIEILAGAEPPAPAVWLAKPYRAEDMRLALEQASALVQSLAHDAPAAAAPICDEAVAEPTAPVPESLPDAAGLSLAQLQVQLASLLDPAAHVFLRRLAQMIALGCPFEARFTVQNSVIIHPGDGWIASNTPMLVIEKVCQSDPLASVVSMREIDASQAEERAHLLGMSLHELEPFLETLLSATRGAGQRRGMTDTVT